MTAVNSLRDELVQLELARLSSRRDKLEKLSSTWFGHEEWRRV